MIKVENIDVYGFEAAIRGMRNPMNSWGKSDSKGNVIGKNDLDLMLRLYKAGTEHRKYLRMITVTMDITAPLYWWKEFDTYKVGTVANSCSTMHKIASKEFTLDDFSHEHLFNGCDKCENPDNDMAYYENSTTCLEYVVSVLNYNRKKYIETKDKHYWWQIIQLLPSSYNQRRTVQFSYENAVTMIKQRTGHKLDEWNELVETLKNLPYVKEITE